MIALNMIALSATVTFDYTDGFGKRYVFNIDRILEHIKANNYPVYEVEIEPGYAENYLLNRRASQVKVDKIELPIREPVVYVAWTDGSHLLIDGNHRYIKAAQAGQTTIKAYILKRRVWKRFLIDER
jgi:hypothetical protein